MPESLPELCVEITKLGNRYLAVTKQQDGQKVVSNEFQHDPTGLTYLGPSWLLDHGRSGPEDQRHGELRHKPRTSRAEVAPHEWRLFHYLFGNGRALHRFLKRIRTTTKAIFPRVIEGARPIASTTLPLSTAISATTNKPSSTVKPPKRGMKLWPILMALPQQSGSKARF